MLKKNTKIRRGARFWALLLLCLLGSNGDLFAQSATEVRAVRVGMLAGRHDIRQLKILTSEGRVPLFSSGNGKPFTIFSESSKQIFLQFYRSPEIEPYNPNRVIIKFYETERALISALILEEVDFAELENEESALEVQETNRHFRPVPLLQTPNKVKMLCYNNRLPILQSRRVRRAFSYAIHHNHIIKKILGNKANLARGPFDSDSPLYNSQLESYKYNPKKAIFLLEQAGWKDSDKDGIRDKNGIPLRLTMYYPKGVRIDEQVAREIKINLLNINVDIQPKPLPMHEINDRLVSRDFEIVLMDYIFENNVESLAEFFSASGEKNYMGYKNQTFDNYLKFYYEDDNKNRRKTLIKSMQKIVNEDQPVTFLYFKWLTHYLVNVNKFEHFLDTESKEKTGAILPFEQWVIKELRP